MEHRIARFRELNDNKWYHIMNFTIAVIQITNKNARRRFIENGTGFYY
jgi:hypothetical protein